MKSDAKRFCDISTLRELRKVQCENEAARKAAIGRVKSASLKVISVSELVLLLVKRYAPANIKEIIQAINQFSRQWHVG